MHIAKGFIACAAAVALLAGCQREGAVEDVSSDWTGNEIEITALPDPAVRGVVCHFASFNRGFLDRVGQGNWFEDPSNSAIACHAAQPVTVAAVAGLPRSAELHSQGTSLFLKRIVVRRVIDVPNKAIIYLSHGREIAGASAKIDMSVVPLSADAPARQTPAEAAADEAAKAAALAAARTFGAKGASSGQ